MVHRDRISEVLGSPVLTDGGQETTLIFRDGLDLPFFASFVLLRDAGGMEALRAYYLPYLEIARRHSVAMMLDTPTWRANPEWGAKLGYNARDLAAANRAAVNLVDGVRSGTDSRETPILIDGAVGPRGDGYRVDGRMSAGEAREYHGPQVRVLAEAGADLVSALTMTYPEEPIGIVRAAVEAGIPVAVSFTVETDGRLPSGQPLAEAVDQVDSETGGAALYFMVNCAHPTHLTAVTSTGGAWLGRLAGLRANASMKSHAELDSSTELDAGDPDDLARRYVALRESMPALRVLGGCCGTDARHVDAICREWLSASREVES